MVSPCGLDHDSSLPLLVFFQTGLVLWALFGFYPSLYLGVSEAAMEQTFILGT